MMIHMAVLIDGKLVEINGANLNDVLSEASRHLEPAGRVVVKVEVDSESLDSATLEARRQDSVAGCELRLTSVEPQEIVLEVLHDVSASLATVRQDQRTTAELLQQDDQAQALQRLAAIIGTWQQVQQGVIQSLSVSQIDVEELKVGDRDVTELLNSLADGLRSLRDQLAAHDTVALADALLYEWPAIFDQWNLLVSAVIDAVKHRSTPRGPSES